MIEDRNPTERKAPELYPAQSSVMERLPRQRSTKPCDPKPCHAQINSMPKLVPSKAHVTSAHPQTNGLQLAIEPPLTIAEVARHYRMSERTVRRRLKDGTLQNELNGGRLVRIGLEQLRKSAEKP